MKHWDLYIYVVVFCDRDSGLGYVSSLQLSFVTQRFVDGFRTRDQTLDVAEAERTVVRPRDKTRARTLRNLDLA